MHASQPSHPDRRAATLANLAGAAPAGAAGCAPPGAGAFDCRIELKLLQWRALAAAARSPRAAAHLARWPQAAHPDLWAGTVQDGVARGFAVLLEEAIALAEPEHAPQPPPYPAAGPGVTAGKELRRKKDLLIASGGPRVRFSRKHGLVLVDREGGVHSENFLRFEARADHGTLDGFAGAPDERPRLYSAQFLQPQRYADTPAGQQLVLAGRLGRGPVGWPCEVELTGRADAAALELTVRIHRAPSGWRLRARFLGVAADAIEHACTPVHETVQNDAGGFVAFTLVRACTTLLVDGIALAVPGAAGSGTIAHRFRIGSRSR